MYSSFHSSFDICFLSIHLVSFINLLSLLKIWYFIFWLPQCYIILQNHHCFLLLISSVSFNFVFLTFTEQIQCCHWSLLSASNTKSPIQFKRLKYSSSPSFSSPFYLSSVTDSCCQINCKTLWAVATAAAAADMKYTNPGCNVQMSFANALAKIRLISQRQMVFLPD